MLDGGTMLGDVSSSTRRGEGETVDTVARVGPVNTSSGEEATERAPTKGGPTLAVSEVPVIRRPHGGPASPQLRVSLAMLVAKRRKLAAPMK